MVKKVIILSTDVSNAVNIACKNLGKLSYNGKVKGILKNLKYAFLILQGWKLYAKGLLSPAVAALDHNR